MSQTYKIRVLFYEGEDKTLVDTDYLSGQEIQSLEDTVSGFTPKGTYMDIDLYSESTFICKNNDGETVAFPEEWQMTYVGKMIKINPEQYGLSTWSKTMYMKFERV